MSEKAAYINTAATIVRAYLSYGEPTPDGIYDILEISSGNKEVLLSHLKAIRNICSKAIEALEVNDERNEERYIDD